MQASTELVYEHIRELRVIHPGEGLRLIALRSMTTILTLVAGFKGYPLFADRSLPRTLVALEERHGVDIQSLGSRLLALEMITIDDLRLV